MTDEKNKLPIRTALIPVFYQRFHCLAQDCRDSCCVDWSITFDKKDYLRLRRLDAPEELKQRLEEGVRRQRKGKHDGVLYGHFDLKSNQGRCPFLGADSLCSIQLACGHEALPTVCKTYPRKTAYSPAAKEFSLSPSCEGVLQQLWDLPEGIEFVEDPLPKTEQRAMTVHETENLTRSFAPIRALCIDILQDQTMPLPQRMICLGIVLQKLGQENWSDFDADKWVGQVSSLVGTDDFTSMIAHIEGNRAIFLGQNLKVMDSIHEANKAWADELYEALEVKQKVRAIEQPKNGANATLSVEFSEAAYEDALERFQAAFSDRAYFFENLMVAAALYMVFPNVDSRESLWKSYVSLCNLYSFYHFAAVLACKKEATKERLFHFLVMVSRATLHNRDRFDGFQAELFQNDSSTLAHMAILLRWD